MSKRKRPHVPPTFSGKLARLAAVAGEHAEPGGIYVQPIAHDDGCPALTTQRLQDCGCEPLVSASEEGGVTCAHCSQPIVRACRGRPPRYCPGGACKQAAYRERRRLERLEVFVAAGLVRGNGHGLELADPLVSLAFSAEPWGWFRVGENGNSRLEGRPWFELWLASLGYDLRDGSPLDGAPLKLPTGPERKAAAA